VLRISKLLSPPRRVVTTNRHGGRDLRFYLRIGALLPNGPHGGYRIREEFPTTQDLFQIRYTQGFQALLMRAAVYNRLPRGLILTNLRMRTVRHRAGLSSPGLRQIAQLGKRGVLWRGYLDGGRRICSRGRRWRPSKRVFLRQPEYARRYKVWQLELINTQWRSHVSSRERCRSSDSARASSLAIH
jgi:hypothetical protein